MSGCDTPTLFDTALDEAIPLSIHWDLTWRCDHKCVHCYLTERRQDELSYEEGVRLLDQMAEVGVMMLLISGGDPFLRPDGIDLIRAARERGFDVKINTHGNFIDDALADQLAEIKPSQVSISLYSEHAHEHEAVTLIKGSHAKSLAAARRLSERGIKVNLKTPVMTHNATGWRGVERLAAEVGARWEVDGHIVPDDQSDFGLCKIGVDPTERVLAVLMAMAPHREAARPFYDLPATPSSARTCSAGTVSGYVSPDGRVSPCINWRQWLGSVREASFKELWFNSPTAKRVREVRRASYLKDCEGCAFHHHCNYCPGLSHAETGDPGRRSAYVCERTHVTMSALEHLTRLNEEGSPIPAPGTEEALTLFEGEPTFADRQWAARSAGLSHPSDRLRPRVEGALIQIDEPR
jgi:radical SAM protein with 4Fe4S-binding SPASM domain